MSGLARRKFMSLLAVAPAAVPVAAKQAASAMGLVSPLTAGMANNFGGMPGDTAAQCNPMKPSASFFMEQIAQIESPENRRRYREQAIHRARVLDSDLASMRSISPAFAYQTQVDRIMDEIIANEKSWWQKQLAEVDPLGMAAKVLR